jgi:hypothetical protein
MSKARYRVFGISNRNISNPCTAFCIRVTLSLLLLGVAYACRQVVGDPRVEIIVQQIDATVKFEFVGRKQIAWLKQRVPHKASYLFIGQVVGSSSNIVWEIEARDLSAGASEITYGLLPPGFEQLTPKTGQPPPLNTDGPYEVTVTTLAGGGGIVKFLYKRKEVVRVDRPHGFRVTGVEGVSPR